MTDRYKERVSREFDNNRLSQQLFGPQNSTLARLEELLDVSIRTQGNRVTIGGSETEAGRALAVLNDLYDRLEKGTEMEAADVDAAVRMRGGEGAAEPDSPPCGEDIELKTSKRPIRPRSPAQAAYMEAMAAHDLVFGIGPAGTGKTYLAVAHAVARMIAGDIDRIILTRPAVEAGEHLGFLPGDLREKVDPYLRPLYDALHDMLPGDQIRRSLENGDIEVAPLAFMRGRTLSDAMVILDEAQNTTPMQMKMFLTRLGEKSGMVINGDLSQVDFPAGTVSGLADARKTLSGVKGVRFVAFSEKDVVRHDLVSRIVTAYEARERKNSE